MIASRWTTNSCCRQPLPLLPGRRSRPSIFSVAAMVAGDNDGLPWRRAGRQWLRLPVGIKKGGKYSPQAFLSVMNTTWAKITPISPTLPHRTPRALCGSVEKNTDSLVKGMILFDQGGGGRGGEGGKGHGRKCSPPSVRGPLVSCCCLRERLQRIFSDIFPGSKILAGNSPAGPPNKKRHDDTSCKTDKSMGTLTILARDQNRAGQTAPEKGGRSE